MSEERIKALFQEALETPAGERSAFLERACGGDSELRREVEALLRDHEAAGAFLAEPTGGGLGVREAAPEAGTRIGPYTVVEELGEGGFGVVYVAEQRAPVRRRVALKVIKPGMDSREVLARFEAERQALALMDHPGIARIFEGGTTAEGRPYFAMELVRGVSITRYCDESRLGVRERLALFVEVCRAVQHAHQKGVIHRDLKPSNVLVAMRDGVPAVKVIDFGVAKATGPSLTEETFQTRFAQMVGTPQYMSPEQAELSPLDVDTRSDVYALGVLLYELLTGTPPFSRERVEGVSFDELRRMIREEEPETPSTRLETRNGDTGAIAARRRTDAKRLVQSVRGDLDWIAMKALEKDRRRRYETASGLARDVERYLADEPVEARPPSAWYRARKLVRRHRTGATVAALVLLVVVVAGGAVGWVARDRAARQATLEERIGDALGQAEAAYDAGRVPAALAAVERAQGLVAGGVENDRLARDVDRWRRDLAMLERLERVRFEAGAVRDERFSLLDAVPAYRDAFRTYGIDLETVDLDAAAARIAESVLRDELIAAVNDWALRLDPSDARGRRLRALADRVDPDPWRRRFREVADRGDGGALVELARDPDVLAQPPATVGLLADALRRSTGRTLTEEPIPGAGLDDREGTSAKLTLAVDLLRESHRRRPDDLWLNYALGSYLRLLGPARMAEAVGYYRVVVALRPESPGARLVLGLALANHGDLEGAEAEYREALRLKPDFAMAYGNLGVLRRRQGRPDDAIALHRKAIDLAPAQSLFHSNLGNVLMDEGELRAAEAEYREAIRLDPGSVLAHTNLGNALHARGAVEEAIECHRKAIDLDPYFAGAYNNLAGALAERDELDEAIEHLHEAVRLDPHDARFRCHLAGFLLARDRLAEAEAAVLEAIDLDPEWAPARHALGNVRLAQRRHAEAERAYRGAIDLDPGFAPAHCGLGNVRLAQGRHAEAERACREAIDLDPDLVDPYVHLGNAHLAQGERDEAREAYEKAIALDPTQAAAHGNLGNLHFEEGDFAQAIRAYEKAIELGMDSAKAYIGLGAAFQRRGEFERALGAYGKAMDLAPDHAMLRLNLGLLHLAQSDLDQAIRAFREAIRLDPELAPAHRNLGVAYHRLGDAAQAAGAGPRAEAAYREAMEAYRASIRLDPDHAAIHRHLGTLLELQGDREGTIRHLSRVVELKAAQAWTLNKLAWHLATAPAPELRDPERAVELAQQAVERAPPEGKGACWNTLGVALYRAGDDAGARDALEQSMGLQGGGSAWDWYVLALAHARLGHGDEARKWYERAVAWHEEEAPADDELGRFRAEAERVLGLAGE